MDHSINLLSCVLESHDDETLIYMKKAKELTLENYKKKRTLFNPIYVSDICFSDCPYCGYRVSNKDLRKTLKQEDLVHEVNFLIKRGVKNILLLAGDFKHEQYVNMLCDHILSIKKHNEINWIGIEIATLEEDEYIKLKGAGADSVTVFQETYDELRYNELHKNAYYKKDYFFRYNAQERAINAGFEEVGFGVLYGISSWKNDTLDMAKHALSVNKKYPNIKFRFSFPRIQLSKNQDSSCIIENISEKQLLKAIIGMRLLFPTSSLVLTGRESLDFLLSILPIVNTIGYGGSTIVGGYATNKGSALTQFELNNIYTFDFFKNKLFELGYELY